AGARARELVAEGVSGMKIWPFDRAAFANQGRGITQAQIDEGLEPFKRARDAVGDGIELMVELHALWDRASAERIVAALAPLAPAWIEDPIRMDDTAGVTALARGTGIPILGCETLAPASSFDAPLEAGAFGIVCCDPGWCGGITQARAIVAKAARAALPFAVHDCTGPIGFAAGAHLSIHAPTAEVQETVRAYLRGWYAEIAGGLPHVERGIMRAPSAPGIGAALKPEFLNAPDTTRRRSEGRP
ncbi:MAG: mandelate racemase/muconate lactonizing enzyme family protein, partial [Tagaea sp.]|nr:mandelate racemase/muconate lactonizing enzyme family protein [Tagaea sp.]